MPRIPQVEPKVGVPSAPSVRQNIQAQPGAFGMGTAQAFTRAGDMGQKIAEELQQRRNVVEVQNAYLAATAELQKYLHDPENGVYSRKGINAPGSFAEVQQRLPEIAAEFTKNLSGAQRQLFDNQWNQSSLPVIRGVMNHESREIENEKSRTAQALQMAQAENMSLNYTDSTSVDTFAEMLKAAIRAQAHSEGWGLDFHQAKEKEIMSKAYAATFERFFAVDDIKGAEAFLDKYQDQMHDAVASKLRNELRAKAQAVFVEQQADIVAMKFQDEGEAMEYIKENYEGDVRKNITKMVQADFQTQRRVENERQNKQFYTAFENIHQSPNRSAALRIVNQEPDVEVRARLLQVVDSKHPIRREGGGQLSDEQKEIIRIQKYVAGQEIANALKPIIDSDPDFYKNAANVAALAVESGVLDASIIKDMHSYASKDGVYSEVNPSKIYSVVRSMGLDTYEALGITNPSGKGDDKRVTESDIPAALVQHIAGLAKNKPGNKLSDEEMKSALKQGLSKGQTSPDKWWGWVKGAELPFYQAVMEGKQRSVDLHARMSEDTQKEMGAILRAVNQPTSKDGINALARDWANDEEQEFSGSLHFKKVYTWAKTQQEILYRGADGREYGIDMRNKTALQDPENWRIIEKLYTNSRRGR